MMQTDILEMMSAAGAQRGDSNIKIRFHFSETEDPLEMLLSEFREQMEIIEQRVVTVPIRIWDYQTLWKITRVGESYLGTYSARRERKIDREPNSERIAEWISRNRSTRRFEPFPDVWKTGIVELDLHLEPVVNILTELLAAFKRYGDDYSELREAGRDAKLGRTLDQIGFSVSQLSHIESDYWTATVAEWLLSVRQAVSIPAADVVRGIITELQQVTPPADHSEQRVSEFISKLDDILNLPIWKKRHEVYAVWIGSQIWQAIRDKWNFLFHVRDGILSFAFAGVHLATVVSIDNDDVLTWWTELQTPVNRLPSGHRSRAIKPDYRIRRAPLSNSHPDALVLEVKQYKRSNKSNFSAALEDYTYACPNAGVLLTNYGPVSERLLGDFSREAKSRTAALGCVRPDREANVGHLRRAIRRVVDMTGRGPARLAFARRVCRLELAWGESPNDLDIHVFQMPIEDPKGVHVYYGASAHGATIALHEDIKSGYGPEVVSLNAAEGTYLVGVHQYSEDGALTTSGAVVTVFVEDINSEEAIRLRCPTVGSGRWWLACEIDLSTCSIRPIDKLVEDPRQPTRPAVNAPRPLISDKSLRRGRRCRSRKFDPVGFAL
jgi:hypothetical protein